jgi:hypothetical protein
VFGFAAQHLQSGHPEKSYPMISLLMPVMQPAGTQANISLGLQSWLQLNRA